MSYPRLLWANFRRHPIRTTLTCLCILIAFVLFGYLAAIGKAFDMGVEVAGADRLVTRHKVSLVQMLPESYQRRIARIDGVEAVTHATWFGGIYQDPKNFFAQLPVVPREYLDMYPEFILSDEEKQRWFRTRAGAVVGKATAEKFGWEIGDIVPIQATIWTKKDGSQLWEFEITGIYEGAERGTDTTQLLFHYDYFDEARAGAEGMVGWYYIRVADPDDAVAVADAVDEEFANSPHETKTATELAFVQGFAKQIGDIGTIITAVVSAVFFTILLVSGNTIAQGIRERTSEIATMKAMGFTDARILVLVMAESILIAALGGLTGLALAWILVAQGDPTGGALPIFFFPLDDLVIGVGLVFALGIVTGLGPAIRAMRIQVADALRLE